MQSPIILDRLKSLNIDASNLKANEVSGGAIYSIAIDAQNLTSTWQSLRAVADEAKYWPVFVKDEDMLEQLIASLEQSLAEGKSVAQSIEKSREIDFRSWVESRKLECELDEYMGDGPEDSEPLNDLTQIREFTLDKDSMPVFTALDRVLLLLVPIENSWHLPAFFQYGGWNFHPDAATHTAAFKHWHEKYGAEPVFIADDTLEFFVSNPPRSQGDAMTLAIEHFMYCEDRVTQGEATVSRLAGALMDATVWYFWFD